MALALLYYGSERVMPDVPDITATQTRTGIKVECDSLDCKWYHYAADEDEVEEFGGEHQQWHRDGMPE